MDYDARVRLLLLALVACSKREPHDDKPVTTPAAPLEFRCEEQKSGPPPKGVPAVVAGKRAWITLESALTVVGEHGLVAAIPIPAKSQGVFGAAATKAGTAIVARAGGHWWMAQLDRSGAPRGTPIDLGESDARAGLVGAVDDTVVVVAQSHDRAQLRMFDLDGKPRGDADLGVVDVDDFQRVPTSHLFAVLQREHAGEPAKLRVFDADQKAFVGASTPTGAEIIVAMAPFHDALLLAGVQGKRVVAARLDATGALSAWKDLAPADDASVLSMPDGAHAFVASDGKLAQIMTDLSLGPSLPIAAGDGASIASETTLYVRGKRFICR